MALLLEVAPTVYGLQPSAYSEKKLEIRRDFGKDAVIPKNDPPRRDTRSKEQEQWQR
jgi:hypothetical protein